MSDTVERLLFHRSLASADPEVAAAIADEEMRQRAASS